MVEIKRGKGRPKGSEKDDSLVLATIANAIIANPSLKPTTAMRQYNRRASHAEIRRWQAKWSERKLPLLDEAKVRVEARNCRSAAPGGGIPAGGNLLNDLAKASRYANGLGLDLATIKILQATFEDGPMSRAMRGMHTNDLTTKVRALHDNALLKIARQVQDNDVVKAARGLQDNALTKLVREQNELMKRFKPGLF